MKPVSPPVSSSLAPDEPAQDVAVIAGVSRDDARAIARNAGALLVASILSKGILFVWQIVLGNWLGVELYGVYGTVFSVLAIVAPVASLSMGLIAIRNVAREPARAAHYWSAMLTAQTLMSGVAYVLAVAVAVGFGYSQTIVGYTAIVGISILLDTFGNISFDLLISQERMVTTSAVDIGHIVIRVALSALFLAVGWGLIGVYIATLITSVGRSVVLMALNWRINGAPHFPVDRTILFGMIRDSLPLLLISFLSLANQNADKLMTTSLIGETATGYLGPAFIISFGVINLLSTTVVVATYPMLSRAYGDGSSDVFGFIVGKLLRFTALITLPVVLSISLLAPQIIGLIYDASFAPTIGVLRILIWYTFITMIGNLFAQAFLVQNRQRITMFIRTTGLTLNIGLNYWLLTGLNDPRGAAIASVISETLIVGLMLWQFRATGYDRGLLLQRFARVGGLAVLLAVVMLPVYLWQPWLALPAGAIVYLLAVARGPVLQADDWDLLYRLLAATPLRTAVLRFWHRPVIL